MVLNLRETNVGNEGPEKLALKSCVWETDMRKKTVRVRCPNCGLNHAFMSDDFKNGVLRFLCSKCAHQETISLPKAKGEDFSRAA